MEFNEVNYAKSVTEYILNVDENPNNQKFLNGWLSRVNFPYPSSQVPAIYV